MTNLSDIKNLLEIMGENEKLELVIFCLQDLINWCDVIYNNDMEKQDAEKLHKAMVLLEEVKESYKNYNCCLF